MHVPKKVYTSLTQMENRAINEDEEKGKKKKLMRQDSGDFSYYYYLE